MDAHDERPVAWIDYVLATDDPVDTALAQEFLNLSWEYGEFSRWILRERPELTPEILDAMSKRQAASDALHKRIHARAQELIAVGGEPADEAQIEAWHAFRRSISATIPSENDQIYRV